jgi:hypothetical protein
VSKLGSDGRVRKVVGEYEWGRYIAVCRVEHLDDAHEVRVSLERMLRLCEGRRRLNREARRRLSRRARTSPTSALELDGQRDGYLAALDALGRGGVGAVAELRYGWREALELKVLGA